MRCPICGAPSVSESITGTTGGNFHTASCVWGHIWSWTSPVSYQISTAAVPRFIADPGAI